jgi:hypothetical protein
MNAEAIQMGNEGRRATLAEIYMLDKRGRAAADGTGDEILLADYLPINDESLLQKARSKLTQYVKGLMKKLGAEEYTVHVGVNRRVTVNGMPLLYYRVYLPKDKYHMEKVEHLQ